MKKEVKRKIILIIILTISAFFLGKYSTPDKIQIKYKEKIIKVIEIQKIMQKAEKRNVKIVTRIIYKKDGTKIEEKIETDNSQINTTKINSKSEKTSKSIESSKKVWSNNKKVTISVFSNAQIIPPRLTPELGVLIQYPTLKFLNTGLGLSNHGRVYLSIGISF